ncbi:GNAT family N-acetyltransferase [Ekhidna sp.]|uniref:GNAT family N-acetyltransferase n=1 Tax=Ekhidna sp. TaxID=2608089 RepID=UPI003C79C695
MSINIYSSPKEVITENPILFYQYGYLTSQAYCNFIAFSDENFFIAFDQIDNVAISIPRSPFGSIFYRYEGIGAEGFIEAFTDQLRNKGIEKIQITHPSEIYARFVSVSTLVKSGFDQIYSDINQHIPLDLNWEDSIHKMQKRKLESLINDGFEFRKMERSELETAHKFLTVCRQAQGLQINISWEQLKKSSDELPEKYECFGVFRDSKISALCIAVNVSSEVAYYYLPGTSPMFRNQSPMVMLIAGMIRYYRERGFKYLDLGVSSIEGKSQEPLKIFKERMGGIESKKPTFLKQI